MGGLSARFGADFSDLVGAIKSAKAEVNSFAGTFRGVEVELQRMVKSFDGSQIRREAELVSAALERVGGTSRLTATEQGKVNTVVEAAIAKYRALGMEVPPHLQKIAAETKQITTATDAGGLSVGKMVGAYAAGLLTFETAKRALGGVVDFIKSSVDEYARAEGAARKLTTALSAQGTATPAVVAQFKQLQETFQQTTVYEDDLIAEMQALFVQVGDIAPDEMGKALTAATNLASGLGIDLRAAVMMLSKANEENTSALKKAGIALDEHRVKAEGLSYILETVNSKFGGQAQAAVDTYAGRIQQLTNAWGNFKERLGEALVANPLLEAALRNATAALQQQDAGLQLVYSSWSGFARLIGGEVAAAWVRAAEARALYANAEAAVLGKTSFSTTLGAMPGGTSPLGIPEALWDQATKTREAERALADAVAKAREELYGTAAVRKVELYIDAIGGIEHVSRLSAHGQDLLRGAIQDAMLATGRATPQLQAYAAAIALVSKPLGISQLTMAPGSIDPTPVSTFPLGSTPIADVALLPVSVKSGLAAGDSWVKGFSKALNGLPEAMQRAIEGGGSIAGAVAAAAGFGIGQYLLSGAAEALAAAKQAGTSTAGATWMGRAGAALTGAITGGTVGYTTGSKRAGALSGAASGAMAGMMFGPTGALIGAGVGAVAGAIGGALGGQRETKQVNDLRDAYIAAAGGLGALNAQAVAAGANLDAMLKARTMRTWEDALTRLNASLTQYKNTQDEIAGNQAQLAALQASLVPTWEDMAQTASNFGISLDALGPAFQQLKQTDVATDLINAFDQLTRGGADVGGVLYGMRDELSQFVQDSIRLGTEIPSNLQPLILELQRSGNLTDANGKKFKDLSGLKWGAPVATEGDKITTAIETLVGKIDALITKLNTDLAQAASTGAAGVTDALNGIPSDVTIGVRYTYNDYDPNRGNAGGPQTSHAGGVAMPWGVVAHRGLAPDEIPAILQTGEGVLSRSGMSRLGAAALRTLNRGEAGPGAAAPVGVEQTILVMLDDEILARAVARKLPRVLRVAGVT